MQSTPPDSTEALDDDAIKVLFEYAGWECRWEELDNEWHIKPSDRQFVNYATFVSLQDALEYMLMYNRLKELEKTK